MEAIDSKLNSNNPMLVAEVFSRLVENVTKNNNEKQSLVYLKNKCLDNNPLINGVASASIIKLVENGSLQIEEILADFITRIPYASDICSITTILANIFYLRLIRKPDQSKEHDIAKMQILQHPFIKILQGDSHSGTQMCVYNEIVGSYRDLKLCSSIFNIYSPVYLYCICSPKENAELSLIRQKLWSFLLKSDHINQTNFVLILCCWIQMQGKSKSELTGSLINEALQIGLNSSQSLPHKDYFILLQILVVYNLVLNKTNCRLIIETIIEALSKTEFSHHNLSLLILSKCVLVCSPIYLEDLLNLCLFMLQNKLCKPYSYLAVKASILPWIASPSILTQDAVKIGEDILKMNDNICRERPAILASRLSIDQFHYSIFCNPDIFLSLGLCNKMDCTREDVEFSLFLENLKRAPVHFLRNSFTFLCGLVLSKKMDSENRREVFSLIIRCCLHNSDLCPTVLTLILYQLSNTYDSKFLFELLKALPLMAKIKENVSKIIATIQAISNKSNELRYFSLRLIYETWEIDNNCYSTLEAILNKPVTILEKDVLESNMSKVYIYKKLAEKRPEVYGRDLVAYLSKILNECVGTVGSVPTALALEGIAHLCKAEIIDIVTTWATLAPKFKDDTRVPVIKSLCQLISEIPHLQYTQTYEKLNEEVVKHLWSYVTTNDNEDVITAALDSLASFSLDAICSQMPDLFLEENFAMQNPAGPRLVPGKVWLTFLSTCRSREAAKQFLIKLVSTEIDDYLKYVYQVKAQREPENYGGLPTHSIVRALGEFLKHNATKVRNWENTEKESNYIDCLQILSLKYSKPLPPIDWCFLQELIHNPKMKGACLDLASHQAVLSGSARMLVEGYMVAITESHKNEEAMHIYRNLKYLANSIQPVVIKPFIENSLHCAFNKFGEDSTFVDILDHLKEVLRDEDVQHINKNVIEDVLRQLVFITEISSKAFPLFLNCIVCFSQKGQEEITKFNSAKFDKAEFENITKIRCYIAENSPSKSRLKFLNDIFEIASKNNVGVDSYIEDLAAALISNLNHEESPQWLMEHFGQIQAKVAERCETSEIQYLCDILTIAVVYFSGFFVLLPKYDYGSIKYFFPAALAFLSDELGWNIYTTQVLEWLHHMNTAESIPKEYQNIFGWSLCCLRHQDEFSKSSKWMKYLDCEICTDNKY